jgi:hypothetical protein
MLAAMIGWCRDCKWSVPNTAYRDAGSHMLDCECEKFVRGYWVKLDELPIDGMHVEDDEGWAFTVGPEFGCIHWEGKI